MPRGICLLKAGLRNLLNVKVVADHSFQVVDLGYNTQLQCSWRYFRLFASTIDLPGSAINQMIAELGSARSYNVDQRGCLCVG